MDRFGKTSLIIFLAIRVYLTVFASQIKMDFIFQSFRGENVFRQEPLVGSIVVKVNGHTDSAFQLNLTGTYPF